MRIAQILRRGLTAALLLGAAATDWSGTLVGGIAPH